MDTLSLVFLSAAFLAALGLGASVPVMIFAQSRLSARVTPDIRVILILALVASGAILTAALTPRVLNMDILMKAESPIYVDYGEGFMASRLMNLALVGACLVEILRGWVQARTRREPDPARPVLYILTAFFVGIILIHLLGSEHRDFSYKDLYVPVILIAVYYLRIESPDRILRAAKVGTLACTAGSLVGMMVSPDSMLFRPSPGLIPGLDFRLYGLAPHANALGPVALLEIMLELYTRSRSQYLRWLHFTVAFMVFVLAQSKTVWFASVIILAMVYLPLALMPSGDPSRRQADLARSLKVILASVAVLAIAVCCEWAFDVSEYIARKVDVATLTGRTKIWEITLDAWRENELFGYGMDLWGEEFRIRYGLLNVGQAHNQFLQTLGDAGAVGLLLLIVYLGMYLTVALKWFFASRGLILAILVMFVIQFTTEAPLEGAGPLSWYTFEHVLLLVVTCHYLRRPADQKYRIGFRRLQAA